MNRIPMSFTALHAQRRKQAEWLEPALRKFRAIYRSYSPRKILAEEMGIAHGTLEQWLAAKSMPAKGNQVKFWKFCLESGIEVPDTIKVGGRTYKREI